MAAFLSHRILHRFLFKGDGCAYEGVADISLTVMGQLAGDLCV